MHFWKITRELRRAYLQAKSLAEPILGPILRRRHDQRKAQLIKFHPGTAPMQENVAVFLLYQPKGVLPSTLDTCRHLARHGFAVLLVSNAPVSEADRARLMPLCNLLMERPNFGYDFGGYRDGVLHVLDSGWSPENLLVLNDSIWFPVRADCDFLAEAKRQTADIYGPVLSHDHLQSYMYNFKRRVVTSLFFRNYWLNLPISNNKIAVVQRCEKLLSVDMAKAGFKMGWLRSSADSLAAIRRLSTEDLARVIRYDQQNDNAMGRALKKINVGQAEWQSEVLMLCETSLPTRYLLKDHPILLLRDLHLPVLKKDRAPHYALQRRTLIDGPLFGCLAENVAVEVQTWDTVDV